jgi:hypothetical protein
MANVINEIKNWCLFTEKFGEEYQMHDAVIKRFDLKRSWGQRGTWVWGLFSLQYSRYSMTILPTSRCRIWFLSEC